MDDGKETICRLCLKDSGQRYPIYGEVGLEKKIAMKIETCSPILMYDGDPLPKVVCYYCVYKLDSAYDFWQTCLESQKSLLSVISASSDECAVQYVEFVKRTRKAKHEINDTFYMSLSCVEQAEDPLKEDPFKEDPFKEVPKSNIEEVFFEEQMDDDFMPETSVVPINVPSSDEEVEEESDVEILDDFPREPRQIEVLGSGSGEKSSPLLNNALMKEAGKTPMPLPLSQVSQLPLPLNQAGQASTTLPLNQAGQAPTNLSLNQAGQASTTLLLNEASQASTTLPLNQAGQASTSLSLNQAGQTSTTLPLNEADQASRTLHLNQAGQASTTLPLNQAGQASKTLSLNQASQASTTLPLNQAGQTSTSLPLNHGRQTPTTLPLNQSDGAYKSDHSKKDSASSTTQNKISSKIGDTDQVSLSNGLVIESVMSMVATQNGDPLFMKSAVSDPSCGTQEKENKDNDEMSADLSSLKTISYTRHVSPSKPTRYNNNSPVPFNKQCSHCETVFQSPISYSHHIAREHGQMRCIFCNHRYKVYRHLMNHVRLCEHKMLNPNSNDIQQETESNFSCSFNDKYKKLGVGSSVPSLVKDTVERTEIYSQSVQAVKKLGSKEVVSHVSESVQRSIDNQMKLKRKRDNDSDVSQETTKGNHGNKSVLGTDKPVGTERLAPVAFDCKTCGEVFISAISLEKHNNSEHAKHSCNICGEAFNSYPDLVFHMKKKCKTRSTAGKASEKPTNSSSKSRLPSAPGSVQNKVYNVDLSCYKCNERLSTVEALKEHYKQVHGLSGLNQQVCKDNSYVSDRQFKGDTNDKEAKDNNTTTKPVKENYPHMSGDLEPFLSCNLCNKKFTNERQLISHLKAHAVLPSPPCESRRVHTNQLVLRSDQSQEALPNQVSGPKGFLCKICNKRCTTNFSFKKHVDKHVEDREVTCKRCGIVFSNNYNLTVHINNCHSPLLKPN